MKANIPGRAHAAKKRLGGVLSGLGAAVLLMILPATQRLGGPGRGVLSILAFGIVLWATEAFHPAVTTLAVLSLLLCVGVPARVVLSGFSAPAWWILVSVLFFGSAMERTGLARRVAYAILAQFPPTYVGIVTAFFAMGFVLMIGVPSMTVRTAIMVPIAWAIVKTLPIERPGRGAALIVLTAFEMAVLPGLALLTGALWGPYVAGLLASAGSPVSWMEYARVMGLPTVVWCGLVLGANLLVARPAPLAVTETGIKRGHRTPIGSAEKATAAVVTLAVLAWATQPWHNVPAEAIGILALAALLMLGVFQPSDLGAAAPWPLLFFVGGMLGITQTITFYKINEWLAGYVAAGLTPFTFSPFVFVFALGLAVSAMRLIEPGGFVTIAVFFLALRGAAQPFRNAPLALAGAILLPIHVFWFSYQNLWLVMTDGITMGEAYTAGERLRFAGVFLAATLVALIIAASYWRWLKII
jgi:di/tricarboxylate transporter